jgi:hypothetical protein
VATLAVRVGAGQLMVEANGPPVGAGGMTRRTLARVVVRRALGPVAALAVHASLVVDARRLPSRASGVALGALARIVVGRAFDGMASLAVQAALMVEACGLPGRAGGVAQRALAREVAWRLLARVASLAVQVLAGRVLEAAGPRGACGRGFTLRRVIGQGALAA